VDTPQRLYRQPVNLFVAAFIGSPAMNLARGQLVGDTVVVGQIKIPLGNRCPTGAQGDVIVGLRPEAFGHSAFADPTLPSIDVTVRVLEDLGSEYHAFFEVDTAPVLVEGAKSDDPKDDMTLLTRRETALFVARVEPQAQLGVNDTVRLVVHPDQVYLFSPETGENLLAVA
jgi:multiple sugar transport system ATP-binding protein